MSFNKAEHQTSLIYTRFRLEFCNFSMPKQLFVRRNVRMRKVKKNANSEQHSFWNVIRHRKFGYENDWETKFLHGDEREGGLKKRLSIFPQRAWAQKSQV